AHPPNSQYSIPCRSSRSQIEPSAASRASWSTPSVSPSRGRRRPPRAGAPYVVGGKRFRCDPDALSRAAVEAFCDTKGGRSQMTAIKDAAAEFLSHRRVAVTGVSRSGDHGSNAVYTRLRCPGYEGVAG